MTENIRILENRLFDLLEEIISEENRYKNGTDLYHDDFTQLHNCHKSFLGHNSIIDGHVLLRREHEMFFRAYLRLIAEHERTTRLCMQIENNLKQHSYSVVKIVSLMEKVKYRIEKLKKEYKIMEENRKKVKIEHDYVINHI